MQAYILLRTFFKEAFLYKTAAIRYEMSRNEAMEKCCKQKTLWNFLKIQGSYKHPLINLLPDRTLLLKWLILKISTPVASHVIVI